MERERDVGNVETKWGWGGVINLDQIPVVVVAGTPLLGCLVLYTSMLVLLSVMQILSLGVY